MLKIVDKYESETASKLLNCNAKFFIRSTPYNFLRKFQSSNFPYSITRCAKKPSCNSKSKCSKSTSQKRCLEKSLTLILFSINQIYVFLKRRNNLLFLFFYSFTATFYYLEVLIERTLKMNPYEKIIFPFSNSIGI